MIAVAYYDDETSYGEGYRIKFWQNWMLFPEAWRGERESCLERVSGISGALMVSGGGDFGIAKTQEAARKMIMEHRFDKKSRSRHGRYPAHTSIQYDSR